MSNKQIVADLMTRLPEEASLTDIAREIEFIAGIREGFAQLDRGEGMPLEEVEKQLPAWISKLFSRRAPSRICRKSSVTYALTTQPEPKASVGN